MRTVPQNGSFPSEKRELIHTRKYRSTTEPVTAKKSGRSAKKKGEEETPEKTGVGHSSRPCPSGARGRVFPGENTSHPGGIQKAFARRPGKNRRHTAPNRPRVDSIKRGNGRDGATRRILHSRGAAARDERERRPAGPAGGFCANRRKVVLYLVISLCRVTASPIASRSRRATRQPPQDRIKLTL